MGAGGSRQLLGEGQRAFGGPVEDAVVIAVHGDGDAFGLYELSQHHEVPMGILLVPKRGGEDVAGGIVDGREERQARAPLLEPIMVAAVELHEQAGSGHALPAPTVSGRAASAGTAEPCRAEDTMDGGLGQHEPFAVGQELAKVRVVDPGVGSLGEMDEPRPGGGRDALGGGTTAVPMDQCLGAVPAVRPAQTSDLAGGEAQKGSRFGHQQLATVQGLEDDQVLLCTLRQGDHASRASA